MKVKIKHKVPGLMNASSINGIQIYQRVRQNIKNATAKIYIDINVQKTMSTFNTNYNLRSCVDKKKTQSMNQCSVRHTNTIAFTISLSFTNLVSRFHFDHILFTMVIKCFGCI